MISKSLKNVLNKQHRITQATQQFVQMPARSAGGGPKKPPMPAAERDFDIVLVGKWSIYLDWLIFWHNQYLGGMNVTALTKFMQTEGVHYKMALVAGQGKSIMPTAYFGVSHGHIDAQKLESSAVSS